VRAHTLSIGCCFMRVVTSGVVCELRYWQPKAWVDSAMVLEWLDGTFAGAVNGTDGAHMLFMDNLAGQDVRPSAGAKGEKLKKRAKKINTIVWNIVSGCTDEVQPVGAELSNGVLLDDMIKMEGFDDAGMVAYRAGLLLPPGPLPPKSALQILRALNLSFQQFLVILA